MRPSKRQILTGAVLALALGVSDVASAGGPIATDLVGAWKLVTVYDQFADGTRRDTWGADPQGLLVFTPQGTFSAIIVAADRAPKAGSVPSDPVGPAIAYFGSYTVDEAAHTFTTRVWQSTFPQWRGLDQLRKIEELNADHLKVVAAPITDPSGRQFVPHLTFDRVK